MSMSIHMYRLFIFRLIYIRLLAFTCTIALTGSKLTYFQTAM